MTVSGTGRAMRPKAELRALRLQARGRRRIAMLERRAAMAAPAAAWAPPAWPVPPAWTVPPAPMAWGPLPAMLGAIQGMLASLGAWLGLFQPAPPPTPWPPAPGPGPAPNPGPAPAGRARFTVASYNILGSSHTVPGADAAAYAAGPTRMKWAADLVAQRGIELVGFQELNSDQAVAFKQAAGDRYALYPGPGKGLTPHNSIAWRKDAFELVESFMVDTTGHKGRRQPNPVVRLRHKATGQEMWVTNFHNAPGFRPGTQQGNRDKALAEEIALINRLKQRTGLPVIVTGDMNEQLKYWEGMRRGADMHAANEGKGGQAPKHPGIDWIFGSDEVRFSGYVRERGALGKKISDHALIYAEARV